MVNSYGIVMTLAILTPAKPLLVLLITVLNFVMRSRTMVEVGTLLGARALVEICTVR